MSHWITVQELVGAVGDAMDLVLRDRSRFSIQVICKPKTSPQVSGKSLLEAVQSLGLTKYS